MLRLHLRLVASAEAIAFQQVTVGQEPTCGLTAAGAAWCWGSNGVGQLGVGSTAGPEACSGIPCSTRPVRVLGGLSFRQVSAGDQHTCGVTTDDVAYCWGINLDGELGLGTNEGPELCVTGDGFSSCSTRPARVVRRLAFDHVDAGSDHTCGVTTSGLAYCRGANHDGQLGRGTRTGPEVCGGFTPCSTRPVPVAGNLVFKGVNAGPSHSCGATTDHAAWCWGSNSGGELGIGTRAGPEACLFDLPCSASPVLVAGGRAFRQVNAGGRSHTCGVTTASAAYCWGENGSGQLGDGTRQDRLRPRAVGGGG